MQIIQSPPGKIIGGQVLFDGRDLLKLNKEEMRRVRGEEIAMIFQEPMTALNPVFTVGAQLTDCLLYTSLPFILQPRTSKHII